MSKIAIPGGGKGSLPYHKRWHSDMIAEVINLDLRERGALFTLVDLMYIHGGSAPRRRRFHASLSGMQCQGMAYAPRSASSSSENLPTATACCASPLVDKELKERPQDARR